MTTTIILPNGKTLLTSFSLGEPVFLKVRLEKHPGMVTAIYIIPEDTIMYAVTWDSGYETRHYEMELTPNFEKNYDTDID